MSFTNRIRGGLMATAAGAGLLAMGGASTAAEYNVGDVKVTLDTTISLGASIRTADRNDAFLPESNGGHFDPRSAGTVLPTVGAATNLLGLALPADVTITGNTNNFDGSINTDDGRLNFDSGDWTGASAKVNHDLMLQFDRFTVFSRFYYFYDPVLDDDGIGRSGLSDRARERVGKSVQLLDLYLSGNFDVGSLPLNIRLGKQVVSWGESTFIQNGINVINPLDASSFRRPGSEIKEGLLPVPMVYASLGLPGNLSIEAFYQLKFEPYKLDPTGSPFSNADIVFGFNTNGYGNLDGRTYTSGSMFSGSRRNCLGESDIHGVATNGRGDRNAGGVSMGVASGILAAPTCLAGSAQDYLTPNTLGLSEYVKNMRGDTDYVGRGTDINPENDGQFGLALRWYAEELGATEFSAYYMNYHSRLPYLSITGGRPTLAISTTSQNINVAPGSSPTSALAGRFGLAAGCMADGNPFTFADPRFASFRQQTIDDPNGLINPTSIGTARAIYAQALIAGGVAPGTAAAAAAAEIGRPNAAGAVNTIANAMQINCALGLMQSKMVTVAPGTTLPMLVNGSETLAATADSELDLLYPEDIEMFGFSFNTTIGGWGVQGEISYRPNAPFQTDTDAQTIESAAAQCALPIGVADLGVGSFEPLNVNGVTNCYGGAAWMNGGARYRTESIIENEMYTFQIGTTATFTTSSPVIEFLGADMGVLVTEIGAVYVPGVENTWLTNADGSVTSIARNTVQFQNLGCQGSDLPLGGLLGLDFKPSEACRPTDFSFGYVLMANVSYNNAFGSGWLVSPSIAFSHDVSGATPSPYGNFLEDRMSLNLSVSATLDNAYRVGVSYTDFFGGGIRNKATDQDFASVTVSYSF